MKILIVDDSAIDRKLLRLNLERHGCDTVIEACDGREGLEAARAHRPELIISDVLMPGMDGFELLHAVRSDGELSSIPVVIHSSVYTGMNDEELALRLGAQAFIPKPTEPEALWGEISAILQGGGAGRGGTPPSAMAAEEMEYLREHCGIVAAKLEQKVRELEESLARRDAAEETLVKLSQAVEQSPAAIVITDTSGTIEFVNPKFVQITGYSREEALGQNPRILKSGETPPEEYRRLWETITSGRVWHGLFHNRRKNGELFWEAATISPIMNREGTTTNFIAIKEDITEKKKLEEQLRHAQKMEAIGQLAGGVAHDFNNILTVIIGFASLMQMKMAADDPLHVEVEQILTAADRAAGLTQSLLAFSRKQVVTMQHVELNEIIRRVGKFLGRIIGEDVQFAANLSREPLVVNADSGQIEQVLMNLATNARDAMPRGGTFTMTTGTEEIDGRFISTNGFGIPGNYAVVRVEDSGNGMDEATAKKVFEPFFTTKEVGHGTGLGLAIVYGIIKQHSGFITVSSKIGEGTAFTIYLPLVEGGGGEKLDSPHGYFPGGTETILVADDDASLRRLVVELLTSCGYTVMTAEDGQDALEKFRLNREKIDLVILDVVMPKLNGRETYDAIRNISPDCKLLFMTGYADDIFPRKGLEDAGLVYVNKPLRPQDLLRKIRDLLDS